MFGDYHLVSKFYKPPAKGGLKTIVSLPEISRFRASRPEISSAREIRKKKTAAAPPPLNQLFRVQNKKTREILDEKFAEIIGAIYAHFAARIERQEIGEDVLCEIFTQLGYIHPNESNERVLLAQATFCEQLALLLDTIISNDKYRTFLQLIHAFEVQSEFDEGAFFEELKQCVLEFEDYTDEQIDDNIIQINDLIGEVIRK